SFSLLCPPPPRSTLFPYTTLFRSHAAGSAGQHSDQCLCDRRPSSRRQHSGPVASRSRSVLLARSRLCGLRSPVCLGPSLCLDIQDRKSTRLNSSHVSISYAVFCLK